ncbi:hypothetical protein [Streptomyces albus]|uniref:hypothetical protein n=1 Tax=Streptomyces albus TaxID=1888 RepID=UPI00068A3E4A|nr:hypothetical protein [Streptomyces albus]
MATHRTGARRATTRAGSAAVSATVSAAALIALAGCGLPGLGGGSSEPTPKVSPEASFTAKAPVPSGKPLGPGAKVPSPPDADFGDPTSVATAWAVTAYSHDTAYDAGPHDAVLRAARYATEKLAAAEREHRPAAGAGGQWLLWAEHKAWTTVKTSLETDGDAPSDTATTAWRQIAVTGKARGRDGWSGPGPRLHAFVQLVRDGRGDPWRVSKVNVVEAATVPSQQTTASPDRSE